MRRHEALKKINSKGEVYIRETFRGGWEIWYKEGSQSTKYSDNETKESASSKAQRFAEQNGMRYVGVR